jgi:hypothetical protein
MEDIIQKLSNFLNYFAGWFDEHIGSGLAGFFKALGGLFITILEFFIDIIRWLIEHI